VQKLAFLLVLVSLLLALIGLNQVAATWHYVLRAEPGKVLYTATFDAYLDDWGQYEGRLEAQVIDGVLRIDSEMDNSGPYSVAKPHFDDFDLRVQGRAVDGDPTNGYGVIFRLQDKGNRSVADDSYYLFLVSSDGYYKLERVIDGQQKEISLWIPSPVVNQGIGAVNTLRVIAQGDRFQFYINDQQVELCLPENPDGFSTLDGAGNCMGNMTATLVDDTIASGQIGMVVVTLDMPKFAVEFDNVLIVGPEPISSEA
jgi:hypothetical protein